LKEQKIISGNKIITPFKIMKNGIVVINDSIIEYVGEEKKGDLVLYDNVYKGEYVIPGL